jgi:hypothetical protein
MLYTPFFDLISLKNRCVSAGDKQMYQYLNIMVVRKIKESEKLRKVEKIDVNEVWIIETNFNVYSKLIFEATILVETFWIMLSKQSFQILELID